ncbi:hypothetical protein D2E59_19975 [Mycobacteroides abscessus]|nr:hypothetical protein D2E27_13790 [Mycobacteroides abscessus]RIR61502.1 hypothetical protein D2E62_23255 [Mycobacteroides abscessus]RIR93871.1 hypothetical protein D2E58_23005 [Mycobacteroides abscessus]RIS36475.1 hypothetical protein D2E48_21985 [Mycobacteroides abscessus]RIS67084.1 hypothetical protein D2E59_19975 [Mycobacteroides abscessus]
MINREVRMEVKLAGDGFTMRDAEAIAERVAQALGDESTFFNGPTHGLAADADSASVGFTSVLWPEFDFEATRDANGVVQSARYRRVRGRAPEADSPEDLLSWSVSVQEFADRFGPATLNYSSTLSEKVLPAHEHYKFEWNGEQYGAGFSWGLFLFAARLWPED